MESGKRAPILWAVALVPLLPWASLLMQRDGVAATTVFPVLLFLWGMMGVGSAVVYQRDPWLGILCGWFTLSLLWTRHAHGFETTGFLVVGSLLLVGVQALASEDRALAVRLVLLGAGLQAGAGLLQAWDLELIWPVKWGIIGSVGNPGYLALFVGALTPVAPLLLIPVFLGVLVACQSNMALCAACLGLLLRWKRFWPLWGCLALAGVGAITWMRDVGGSAILRGLEARLSIWHLGMADMTAWQWVIGHGPGEWLMRIPRLQDAQGVMPGMYFVWAHNEWVQLVYEGGAVAVLCMVGWMWTHRQSIQGVYAGAILAMVVMSSGWFVFHLPNVAIPFAVLVGVATAGEPIRLTWPSWKRKERLCPVLSA